MNTAQIAATPAFTDEKLQPKPEEVAGIVGRAEYAEVAKLNAWIDSTHHHVTREWKYSATAGWYEIPSVKERRLFYFMPQHGGFRLNIVLGDKAITSLANGPHARRVASLLKTAKRYPEGTVFTFDAHSLDADLAAALLRAKLGH